MTTITPRTFATRRVVYARSQYEKIANLIKKYGCVVSKVSDFYDPDNDSILQFMTIFYFEIPVDSKESFLKEEQQ